MGLPSVIHHLPEDDIIEHEATQFCVCGPKRESIGYRQVGRAGQHVIALVHQTLKRSGDGEVDGRKAQPG